MLKWIVPAKVDHPLADVKDTRALAAALPSDAIGALKKAAEWLEPLEQTQGLKTDRLFEIVEIIDAAAKNHQGKIFHDYLAFSRQQKLQEHTVWTTGFNYSKELARAYSVCAERCESGAGGASAARKQLTNIVARALHALMWQMKWSMSRYAQVEPGFWSTVGKLHGYARKGKLADASAMLHPGVNDTSIRREYLAALMLSASRVDVLPPVKQEIAARLISNFAGEFRDARSAFDGAVFVFDPLQDNAPARKLASAEPGPGAMFFGAGAAREKIAALAMLLAKGGAVPDELKLGKTYAPDVLSVLKHLATYWSDTPPTRAAERRAASARITVVPGHRALLEELERQEGDELDFSARNGESWVVENVSATGYGAVVPATAADWVRTGELVGLQGQGKTVWTVAIVRRVVRDERRQYHVGIEVISRSAVPVRVTYANGRDTENAILLNRETNARGEVGVILKATRYDAVARLEIELDGQRHVLKPSALIESGEDYDRVAYKLL